MSPQEPDTTEVLPFRGEEGELVTARPAPVELERRTSLPKVQAAAAAAGGFVAGAAVVGLVGRRHARSLTRAGGGRGLRGGRRSAGLADRLQIVGSRSLLLDVHLLGGPAAER
jgi:hypothetical protein